MGSRIKEAYNWRHMPQGDAGDLLVGVWGGLWWAKSGKVMVEVCGEG